MTRTSHGVALSAAEVAAVRAMVVYEDAAVLAFDKPAGLSSQGGRGGVNTLDEHLHAFARTNGKRPQLVHRLDRDTSGVILAAKTQPAASFLGKALMARQFAKTYLAILAAAPEPSAGVIEAALRREEIGREAYSRVCAPNHPDAQIATSRYRTLALSPLGALVELRPETGRMHQLRVHLAHLGRPIAGDQRYGGPLVLGGVAVGRLMLHAASLEFPSPLGGRLRVEAPAAGDFAVLAAKLGLGLPPPRARVAVDEADAIAQA